MHNLGPQSQRVYQAIRRRIATGELQPGARVPSHRVLAVDFGIAPLTIRQALARLEEDGYVVREPGRGTFVRVRPPSSVLIVEDDADMRALLEVHTAHAGYRPLTPSTPAEALACLERDPSITMVISDLRMPDGATGVAFIRAVRQRWPALPLVAMTGFPQDLAPLHGTPECPVHILVKPVWAHQVEEILRLARS